VLYAPFLLRDLCGGVKLVKCCGKWTAILGGATAIAGGLLALTAYLVMLTSDLRRSFQNHWADTKLGDITLRTGDTPVMDCAAASAAFAVVGGVLVILRGTACTGKAAAQHDAVPKEWT